MICRQDKCKDNVKLFVYEETKCCLNAYDAWKYSAESLKQ